MQKLRLPVKPNLVPQAYALSRWWQPAPKAFVFASCNFIPFTKQRNKQTSVPAETHPQTQELGAWLDSHNSNRARASLSLIYPLSLCSPISEIPIFPSLWPYFPNFLPITWLLINPYFSSNSHCFPQFFLAIQLVAVSQFHIYFDSLQETSSAVSLIIRYLIWLHIFLSLL